MTGFSPHSAIVAGSDPGIGRATDPDGVFVVTGALWDVDGGMPQMGPQTGSHPTGDEWRNA